MAFEKKDMVQLDRKAQILDDEAKQLNEKKDRFQKSFDAAKNKNCFMGLFPNSKALNLLSKNVQTKALIINDPCNEQGTDSISLWPPVSRITEPSLFGPKALPSRVLVLKQIMGSLGDPNLNRIGVYGIGGVGKTTLLQEVQQRASHNKIFQIVIMVSISWMPSLRQIQAQIADFIGLKLHPKDVSVRAAQLCKWLKKAKVLIILDDLWKKIDLQDAGIPSWEESSGCKILLSSRKKDVLSCEMQTQVDFSLNVLEQEEAWDLFQTTMPKVEDQKLHTLASEIAKKCVGLPILVQIVAKVLLSKELNASDIMQKHLSAFGNEDHIQQRAHQVVTSVFENLPEEEKSVFLLCALFDRSSIHIEYLLICCLGLDLLKGMNTIEEARNRLITLIDNLREGNLLQGSPLDGYVMMPGTVHDVAISIASRFQFAFIGAGEVRTMDWPCNNCTRISLPHCSSVQGIYAGLHCPMAELFLLSAENLCLEIPDPYFEGITGLKVVSITGVCFQHGLPLSLGLLTNLQSLWLNGCQINDVASVAELKQLQFLSFADSRLVKLPREMEGLTKLKVLDLRNCTGLEVIPEGVLSKLHLLEELYMLNSFVGWDTRGNARLAEFENLSHLSTLEMQVVEPKLIPRDFGFIHQLQNYKISMGDKWIWDGKYGASKVLKIKQEAGIRFEGGIREFLKSTQDLYINTTMGINSLFDQGLPRLKHLHIGYEYGIQHLLNSVAKASHRGFPSLESLHVYNFHRSKQICDGEDGETVLFEEGENGLLHLDGKGKGFPRLKHIHIRNDSTIQNNKLPDETSCPPFPGTESLYLVNFNSLELLSFWKLISLTVLRCNKMRIVFTFSSAGCLSQLQELEVGDCENIEAIVGGEDHHGNYLNQFTRLSSLKLSNLPRLRSFCKREEGTSKIKLLFDETVSFPNMKALELRECKSLKNLFTTETGKCLPKLEKLEISNCKILEEIILNKETEEIEEERFIEKIVFPKLEYLSLSGLQKVRRFGSGHPIEFLSLKELSLEDCPTMESFVSKFSANKSGDYLFNEMVTFASLEIINVRNVGSFKYLWHDQMAHDDSFFKLRSLTVVLCLKMSVVFPSNIFRRFQRLELLHVLSCDSVEEILQFGGVFQHTESGEVPHNIVLPKLDNLSLVGLQNLEKFTCGFPIEFPSLTKLSISSCSMMNNFVPTLLSNQSAQCFFNEMVSFPNLEELEIRHANNHRYLWDKSFRDSESFSKLKSLKIGYCLKLSVVFPLNACRRFRRLEALEIRFCPMVEEIYQFEGANFVKAFALRDLQIWNLPSLHIIWNFVKVPWACCLKDLQSVEVRSCQNLEYVFPKSVACNLHRLQRFYIGDSHVQVIIAKENRDEFETKDVLCLKFPRLSAVRLENLTQMRSLYEGTCTLKCPQLKHFEIHGCDKMLMLGSEISAHHRLSNSTLLKFIKNLEELTLDHQGMEAIVSSDFPFQFSKLKTVTLRCLEKESIPLLFSFIRRHSLEKIVIVESSLEDIFLSDNELASGEKLRFKQLELVCDDNVKHIVKGKSQDNTPLSNTLLKNLETMNIEHCDSLLSIAPSAASFHNLTSLSVTVCFKMEYLVTSSTANTMQNLKDLRVSECIVMENIVIESDESRFAFEKLRYLELNNLPRLNCFCSGKIPYIFPALKQVIVNKCYQMKTFFGGPQRTPRLTSVVFDGLHMSEDLNAALASRKSPST